MASVTRKLHGEVAPKARSNPAWDEIQELGAVLPSFVHGASSQAGMAAKAFGACFGAGLERGVYVQRRRGYAGDSLDAEFIRFVRLSSMMTNWIRVAGMGLLAGVAVGAAGAGGEAGRAY